MKLEAKTLNVLKNFSTINPSILFKEGSVVSTISPTKTVLAKAKVDTNFTKRFAIYDLSRFLGSMSLINEPDLDFKDNFVKVVGANGVSLNYTYSDESTIKTPPEKELKLPSVDISMNISDTVLKEIIRACGALSMPEIAIVGDGTDISIQALDVKNPNGDIFNIKLGTIDKTFRAIFKLDNIIKLMSDNYEVKISSKGISHWGQSNNEVEYWIAVETSSTF